MINPANKLFYWGPIDGRLLPTAWWQLLFHDRSKSPYAYQWPEFVYEFKDGKMLFISEYKPLRQVGLKVFNKWFLNKNNHKKLIKDLRSSTSNLEKLQRQILNIDLNKLSDIEFFNIYKQWDGLYQYYWHVWLMPELANFGGEDLLIRELKRAKLDVNEYNKALEVLTAPVKLSFFQKEERDLLKLSIKYGEKDYSKYLSQHQKKYYWLLNSYHHTRVLDSEYFNKRIKRLLKKEEVELKLKNISEFGRDAKRKKRSLIKQLSLSKNILNIAELLGESIWLQDDRKARTWRATHVLFLFVKEMGRRLGVSHQDILELWPDELKRTFQSGRIPQSLIKARKRHYVSWLRSHEIIRQSDKKAEKLINRIKSFVGSEKTNKLLTGVVASSSKDRVVGRVQIILSAKDLSKMKTGNILVTSMTAPDYIVAMRKAAGIITDTGGLTSHAAIVSRELSLPCIIGTNIATKVLRNGEMVEMDTIRGQVKKL
ncbi:PEP-utilizing enzyme [Patescibacteria group bacterium]